MVANIRFVKGIPVLVVGDHVIELHTGGNASQVTALIDGGEGVVVVAQALGVSLGAGGVAELHVGELLGSLNHVVLVTEGVGEDDVAAVIGQLSSRSNHHLEKMENKWLANQYQEKLRQVSVALGTSIPATLNLEQQSYFALGYYQMGAKLSQEKKERSAAGEKAAAEE